jgi:hypothetical protein
MVRDRTDAAQALHHDRYLPERTALDKLFKAAEFDDVQAHLTNVIVFVEKQGDLAMTFDARDGVDGDRRSISGFVAVSSSGLMGAAFSRT